MLNDYDVPYTTFEMSDRIGGNWAFGNPNGHSSAYRSLHIDTSKHRLSFKDFPDSRAITRPFRTTPISRPIWTPTPRPSGCWSNIEFNNGVVHARRDDGGGWRIDDQAGDTREFDLLVVANGHHWDPRWPEFPGTFTGEADPFALLHRPAHPAGVDRQANPGGGPR